MHDLEHWVLQQEEYQPASSPLHFAYEKRHLRFHEVTKVYSPAPTVAPPSPTASSAARIRSLEQLRILGRKGDHI